MRSKKKKKEEQMVNPSVSCYLYLQKEIVHFKDKFTWKHHNPGYNYNASEYKMSYSSLLTPSIHVIVNESLHPLMIFTSSIGERH